MFTKRFFLQLIWLLTFNPLLIFGQNTDNQQYPLGLHWKMIRSEHYDIIFPETLYDDAQRVANTMDHVYAPLYASLKKKPKRYEVI